MAKEVFVTVQPITGEPVYIEVQQDYAPVQAVNGRIGWITLDKSDVGLNNVENISILGASGHLQYQIDQLDTGYASQAEINLLSGLLGQTGSYLYTTITNLSGDIISNYATKIELGNTGTFLYNLVNALSGYGNGTFATITNLATTGSNLNDKINNLSGYTNNTFATISNLATTGQNLQNQINNLDLNYASDLQLSQTGAGLQSQINSLYSSGFLTGVDLSPYYLKSNPSGYITGVDLSNYATLNNLASTGQNLQNQINNLDNVYATDTSLAQTGQFLDQKIDTFSGTYQNFVNNLDTNYASQSEFDTLSGNLNLTGQNLDNKINSLSGAAVLIYGGQTISGLKDFATRPTVNTVPVALSGEASSNIEQWVKNDSNTTLYKAQPVYVSGSNGNNILIHPASNSGEGTSSKTFGLLKQTLLNNEQGYVVTEGPLLNVDTSMATEGDPIWLGPTGNLIYGLANKPKAPQHLVSLGFVERAHQNQGKIFIKVQNGFEIDELHDVRIVNKQNSDIIIYNSGSGLWLNSGVNFENFYTKNNPSGFITGVDLSNYYTNNNPSGFITGVDLSSYVTASQTGIFYTNDNPSGFITGVDTSNFYTKDNPSGYITGVDTSNFYTKDNPSGYITGVDLSNYVTNTNLQKLQVQLPTGIEIYTGTFNTAFNSIPTVVATIEATGLFNYIATMVSTTTTGFVVDFSDVIGESGVNLNIIAYN